MQNNQDMLNMLNMLNMQNLHKTLFWYTRSSTLLCVLSSWYRVSRKQACCRPPCHPRVLPSEWFSFPPPPREKALLGRQAPRSRSARHVVVSLSTFHLVKSAGSPGGVGGEGASSTAAEGGSATIGGPAAAGPAAAGPSSSSGNTHAWSQTTMNLMSMPTTARKLSAALGF